MSFDPHDIHKYGEDRFGIFSLYRDEVGYREIMRHTYHDGTFLEKPIFDAVLENAADPNDVYANAIRVLTHYAEIRFENKPHLIEDLETGKLKWAGGDDE
jgi:hypothetical protein